MEMFDVVNEKDEVIDQQARADVHRLGLRHRAVHVLIFNQQGHVFLQKRSAMKDSCPGAWDSSASGHLCPGETYDACAIREVEEELGLCLNCVPAKLFKIDACEETGQEFVWVYRCDSEGPFRLHPEEIETGGWFSPGKVREWMREQPEVFTPGLIKIWGLAFNS